MPASRNVTVSATLATDEVLERLRLAKKQVIPMASGEIGLPVHPALRDRLAAAADRNAYGPVSGAPELCEAVARYWARRGFGTDPDLVVCGPGSKPLLFGLLLAIGGDVVVPVPSWVSYAAHARLAGVRPIPVPIRSGQGGVPDPDLLREAVGSARASGREVSSVVVTVPDNPTGTVAADGTVRRLCETARELDLVIVSDEIYRDLVFVPPHHAVSPAVHAPERTVITTGLTKNLALGGWRIGAARFPDSSLGRFLCAELISTASHIWSSPSAPVQAAAAHAFNEPPELVERLHASRRLHKAVATAVADSFVGAGATVAPPKATCYLYPDFEPLREHLARVHGVRTGADLTELLTDRHGMVALPGSAFGEPLESLRLRASTSRLYGDTEEQRESALNAEDPLSLPWIRTSLDRVEEIMRDLATATADRR